MPDQPAADDRRLHKYFAAFAHNLRRVSALPAFAQTQVSVLSDRRVVVLPAPSSAAFVLEPRFLGGPTGPECFIHCRVASGADGRSGEPLPPAAVWRCNAAGVVTRYPEDGEPDLGYLCDSVAAAAVLRTLSTLPRRADTGSLRPLEKDPWIR